MALQTNELWNQATRGPLKKIQPANGPGAVTVRSFTAVAGAPTLPVGTPLYVDLATGFLTKIAVGANGVTNDIYAIVWPIDVKLDASFEVLGTVMEKGAIHFSEIEALQTATVLGGTLQQLKDNCRKPANRERGIMIEGLDLMGGNAGI